MIKIGIGSLVNIVKSSINFARNKVNTMSNRFLFITSVSPSAPKLSTPPPTRNQRRNNFKFIIEVLEWLPQAERGF